MTSQHSPLTKADIQVLAAHVSPKGSYAKNAINPSGEKHVADVMPTMGSSTIHKVTYADDVVKVSVGEDYDSNTQVPFPTLEVQYVRQTLHTFIA